MIKKKTFFVETTKSITCFSSSSMNYSLAIELELCQVERLIVGLLLIKDELIDTLIIKDNHSKEKMAFQRHKKFKTSIVKGKVRARSIISKCDDNNWCLLITENDVKCVISWYLRAFIDDVDKHGVLDIECEETNMLMFATKQTDVLVQNL